MGSVKFLDNYRDELNNYNRRERDFVSRIPFSLRFNNYMDMIQVSPNLFAKAFGLYILEILGLLIETVLQCFIVVVASTGLGFIIALGKAYLTNTLVNFQDAMIFGAFFTLIFVFKLFVEALMTPGYSDLDGIYMKPPFVTFWEKEDSKWHAHNYFVKQRYDFFESDTEAPVKRLDTFTDLVFDENDDDNLLNLPNFKPDVAYLNDVRLLLRNQLLKHHDVSFKVPRKARKHY